MEQVKLTEIVFAHDVVVLTDGKEFSIQFKQTEELTKINMHMKTGKTRNLI